MDRHGAPRAPAFRFMRIAPAAPDHQLEPVVLRNVAELMVGGTPGAPDSHVPAGYTYFGQFVAHDLSFDMTRFGLATDVTPERMKQHNSPALDLDSLYGGGPRGKSLAFYDGAQFRTGTTTPAGGVGPLPGHDLPRDRRKAVIADPRNDDNLAIAQTHAAFMRVHNRVVAEGADFHEARKLITLHFQWLVWHDHLPRVCSGRMLDTVLAQGRTLVEPGADPRTPPRMPVEFSTAAFRLGHSMVRSIYPWNSHHEPGLNLADLFALAGRAGDLQGHDTLPSTAVADFRRLFDMHDAGGTTHPALMRARPIDIYITSKLGDLEPAVFDATAAAADERNLAYRNLMRARMVSLATGQDLIEPARARGLSAAAIGGDSDGMEAALGPRGLEHTPLWIYILREAESNGGRLRGVGARIVAETIHRAIEGSRISLFRDHPGWTPTLGAKGPDYTMAHLLLYAAGGVEAKLSPAG